MSTSTEATSDLAGIESPAVLHGELLCEALDVHPGERVLDVAAGHGAAALAAARRGADVTAIDFADTLLDGVRRVADVCGLTLTTRVADARALPFDEDTFDAVMSTFGAMFAPDPPQVADELVRVCRPSGRIGLCNWAPGSLVGDVFRVIGDYVPPAPGAGPAIEWGSEERLRELFAGQVRSISVETRQLVFRYRSPERLLDWFRHGYGPTRAVFAGLDAHGRARLAADLMATYSAHNRADDGTLVAPSDYVEIVAVVR